MWATCRQRARRSPRWARTLHRAAHWRWRNGSIGCADGLHHLDRGGLSGEELLVASGPHAANVHLEEQALAGQRMVQVHHHHLVFHLTHGDRVTLAAAGPRIEAEA